MLQVLPSLEGGGGVERGTVDIARGLLRLGMTSGVACAPGRTAAGLAAQGVISVPIRLDRKNPVALVRHVFALVRAIRKHRIDLLHVRSRAPAWSAFFAARWTGVPLITTFHSRYSGSGNWLKRGYNRIMLRARAVIAVSPFIARHIVEHYPIRGENPTIHVIERGVDRSFFDPDGVDEGRIRSLRQRWRVDPQDRLILLPGRISPRKGHRWFLESFADMRRRDVRAVLVGAVGRRRRLEALKKLLRRLRIADRVIIAGHCSDMPAAYRAADIVVVPSLKPEAFGRVVAEALAMGKPVVGADHGAFRDIAPSRIGAFGVDPGNRRDLTRVLDRLIDRGAENPAAGRRRRAHIRRRFGLDRMIERTLAVYRQVHERAVRERSRRHILVIRFGALGDFVRASGAMRSIRDHHRDDWITMLTTPPFVGLARDLGFFDRVLGCRRPSWLFPIPWWRLIRWIRRDRPALVYDLQNSRRSRRLRWALAGRRPPATWCGEDRRRGRGMTALQRYQRQLTDAGLGKVFPPDLSMLEADLSRFGLTPPYALMVPGAGKSSKCWPADRYGAIARDLSNRGIQTVLIGQDRRRARAIREGLAPGGVLDLTGRTTVPQLASLGIHALAALGNDTGPMHVFAAVGCRCLVLGCESYAPDQSAPTGDVRLLSAPRIEGIEPAAVRRAWAVILAGEPARGT